MNHLVIELIKSFDPSRKKRSDVQYNEFLAHIYMIYDKPVSYTHLTLPTTPYV